jgi:hypothetical protein
MAKRHQNVADWPKRAPASVAVQTESRREDAMPVLIAAGFFILITALVIWGSSYMGPDTRANKPH